MPQPYLLFLGDITEPAYAKTAYGLRDWAPELCIGEYACEGAEISVGLPRLTPEQARRKGARSLVIGIANSGGVIAPAWLPYLEQALAAGLDVISGMHRRLEEIPVLKSAAERHGQRLIDVRRAPAEIPVASGIKRAGKRLLTIGTDCALGKKYTALTLTRAFRERGIAADFRATGQTGILIAGGGIAIDAVVSDFAAGAAEMLTPEAPPDHWDVIEGQGALLHPAYAGVSLSLLFGSQPDVVVICHEAGRERTVGHPCYPLPGIEETIDLALRLGKRTNPKVRCGGVSINTARLGDAQADEFLKREADRLGVPVADPMRGGELFEALAAACLG